MVLPLRTLVRWNVYSDITILICRIPGPHIYGGRLNDVSFTVNYYINKYMIWRFRYSYTKITDRVGFENQSLSAFQTRFQVIF